MIDALYNGGMHLFAVSWWAELVWPVIWNLIKIVVILLPLMGAVAYLTLWERKLLGFMQVRHGPNRVGPRGLLQPIADAVKLLTKEIIHPTAAARGLFFLGPLMAIMPALAAWAVIPFGPDVALANVNAGLLLVMAITSIEVYGVIIAGWSSNSKYAFLGALRASAQMVSYEIAMGFCFLVVLMVSGSMNLTDIVMSQGQGMAADKGLGLLSWNWLPLLPIFLVYLISGVAETNRHPFDVVEGEAEIVAGHMVEYSGMGFAVFFLAEYASMWLVSILAVIMFLGGGCRRSRCSTSSRVGSGWRSRLSPSYPCSSGFARPSRVSAMTRSCVWDGRSSSRSRWYGCLSSGRGCKRPGIFGIENGGCDHGFRSCFTLFHSRFLQELHARGAVQGHGPDRPLRLQPQGDGAVP